MKRIWSPWRMDYIVGDKPAGCVFCSVPQGNSDLDNLVLFRGEHCYVMLNRYPYNNGHLMVIPYRHIDSPTKLTSEALTELMAEVNLCLDVLQGVMRPNGFNIGMNLGESAGAGIKDHVHMHVVPRWTGDTNFMPVIGETHVIVEGLRECYVNLKPAFDAHYGETGDVSSSAASPARADNH